MLLTHCSNDFKWKTEECDALFTVRFNWAVNTICCGKKEINVEILCFALHQQLILISELYEPILFVSSVFIDSLPLNAISS